MNAVEMLLHNTVQRRISKMRTHVVSIGGGKATACGGAVNTVRPNIAKILVVQDTVNDMDSQGMDAPDMILILIADGKKNIQHGMKVLPSTIANKTIVAEDGIREAVGIVKITLKGIMVEEVTIREDMATVILAGIKETATGEVIRSSIVIVTTPGIPRTANTAVCREDGVSNVVYQAEWKSLGGAPIGAACNRIAGATLVLAPKIINVQTNGSRKKYQNA